MTFRFILSLLSFKVAGWYCVGSISDSIGIKNQAAWSSTLLGPSQRWVSNTKKTNALMNKIKFLWLAPFFLQENNYNLICTIRSIYGFCTCIDFARSFSISIIYTNVRALCPNFVTNLKKFDIYYEFYPKLIYFLLSIKLVHISLKHRNTNKDFIRFVWILLKILILMGFAKKKLFLYIMYFASIIKYGFCPRLKNMNSALKYYLYGFCIYQSYGFWPSFVSKLVFFYKYGFCTEHLICFKICMDLIQIVIVRIFLWAIISIVFVQSMDFGQNNLFRIWS